MSKQLDFDFFENIDEMMNKELKDVKADNFTYDEVVNKTLASFNEAFEDKMDAIPDYEQERLDQEDNYCLECGGSGIISCDTCNDGNETYPDGCPECGGMGGEPCSSCDGTGLYDSNIQEYDTDSDGFEQELEDDEFDPRDEYADTEYKFDESVEMLNKKTDYNPKQRHKQKKVGMRNTKKIKVGKKFILVKTSMKENEKSPASPMAINEGAFKNDVTNNPEFPEFDEDEAIVCPDCDGAGFMKHGGSCHTCDGTGFIDDNGFIDEDDFEEESLGIFQFDENEIPHKWTSPERKAKKNH